MPWARTALRWLLLIYAADILVAIYAAGLGVFGTSLDRFRSHQMAGWSALGLAFIVVLAAAAARLASQDIASAVLLFGLTVAQPFVALAFREQTPVIAAFHLIIPLVLLALVVALYRAASRSPRHA